MMVWTRRFNLYLALVAALALLCGCQMFRRQRSRRRFARPHPGKSRFPRHKPDHFRGARRSGAGHHRARSHFDGSQPCGRQGHQYPGGFAIEIQFDENGTWLLEQYSAANPGGHFAIFGQWGDKLANGRWLAAPLITRRIADGVLAFTPDCSRAEADQLVPGLNNVASQKPQGSIKMIFPAVRRAIFSRCRPSAGTWRRPARRKSRFNFPPPITPCMKSATN